MSAGLGTKKLDVSISETASRRKIHLKKDQTRKLKHLFATARAILGMLSVASPIDPDVYKQALFGESIIEPIRIPERLINPVISSCEYALAETNIVQISEDGVKKAAAYISLRMFEEAYSPRTWRTQPLHICPPDPYSPSHPLTKGFLDWIFLVSSLNFSFWSEKGATSERYGVKWRESWNTETRVVHTGYWSLVAALNRALEENIPITDPSFYASEVLCPDALIAHVFRQASVAREEIPLLKERIAIMREVGTILCDSFGGSYAGFLTAFQRSCRGRGTALELAQTVTNTFPSFRDERTVGGRRVFFWKRAQILVAETWAAFFPADPSSPHPIFPNGPGPCISSLTMFADYRVPQVLHHLGVLEYPPSLQKMLENNEDIPQGSDEEVSLRAASIVSVERIRAEILRLRDRFGGGSCEEISSVLIDFYLWDLSKKIEKGEDRIEGIESVEMLPTHRTRCTWY